MNIQKIDETWGDLSFEAYRYLVFEKLKIIAMGNEILLSPGNESFIDALTVCHRQSIMGYTDSIFGPDRIHLDLCVHAGLSPATTHTVHVILVLHSALSPYHILVLSNDVSISWTYLSIITNHPTIQPPLPRIPGRRPLSFWLLSSGHKRNTSPYTISRGFPAADTAPRPHGSP